MKLTLIDGQEIEAQVGETLIGLRVTSVTLTHEDFKTLFQWPDYLRLVLGSRIVPADPPVERCQPGVY